MAAMALTNSCASVRRPSSRRKEPPERVKSSKPARDGGRAWGGGAERGAVSMFGRKNGATMMGRGGKHCSTGASPSAYTRSKLQGTTDTRSSLSACGPPPAHAPFGPNSTRSEMPGTENWTSETGAVVEPAERAVRPEEPSVSVARFSSGDERFRDARMSERSWAWARRAAGEIVAAVSMAARRSTSTTKEDRAGSYGAEVQRSSVRCASVLHHTSGRTISGRRERNCRRRHQSHDDAQLVRGLNGAAQRLSQRLIDGFHAF